MVSSACTFKAKLSQLSVLPAEHWGFSENCTSHFGLLLAAGKYPAPSPGVLSLAVLLLLGRVLLKVLWCSWAFPLGFLIGSSVTALPRVCLRAWEGAGLGKCLGGLGFME